MDQHDRDRLERGRAAFEAGRLAGAYALLLPLAEAGHPEAQSHIGALVAHGLHRFESYEQLNSATPLVDEATIQADRERGAQFLRAASEQGVGPASFNLAGLYVTGYGGGTWEERKAKAAELYARAYAQGMTAFGWLMNGDGAGQPYLDIVEGHAANWCPRPGEPGAGG